MAILLKHLKICFLVLVCTNNFSYAQIGSEEIITPLTLDFNGPLIDVQVNGKPARLLYDSGASHTALFEQSFPEFTRNELKNEKINGFGGDQTANAGKVENITLQWQDVTLEKQEVFLIDYILSENLNKWNDQPFFEGITSHKKISNRKYESVIVFDIFEKKMRHLPLRQKANFSQPQSFKLTRHDGWEWRVTIPVTLTGESKKRKLTLIVDTGFGGGLILNKQKLAITEKINERNTSESLGLGGVSIDERGGLTRIHIGKKSVLVSTQLLETLPGNTDVDGYIGWDFLRRFKSAFDFNKNRMILDLKDADLSNDKPHESSFTVRALPTSDWTGMRIFDVDLWATSGLKKGDILKSIDGTSFSKSKMFSLLRSARYLPAPKLCWIRNDEMEVCSQVTKN